MGLEIKNLNKSFGRKELFNNLNYTFSETGIYSLVGESGIGKTTLLRIIAGLDADFSGEIFGGGIKNCSMVFQEYRLFPTLSAIDNIILANYDKKNEDNILETENILSRLGFASDDMKLFPSELSGGMKQRVSIARALMRNTPILILDEPTKELDEDNAKKALEIIKTEGEKRTVIIVTHRLADIEFLSANKIIL